MEEARGKSSISRERLSKLLREGGEVLTVDNAARILGLGNEETAKALARWRNQGWLARIKRGVYVTVPLEARDTARALEDAWIVIPELFEPAYVGGWSAAEHWDLTEQIFRDICVFTARPVTRRHRIVHNIPFAVTHAPPAQHFGTRPQSLHLPQRGTRPPGSKERATKGYGAMRYVFRCATCNKQFTRSTYDADLNPHKNKQGTPCYGRVGLYVKTIY
jgi:hypothetical protein